MKAGPNYTDVLNVVSVVNYSCENVIEVHYSIVEVP